jgi:hypothetical protein
MLTGKRFKLENPTLALHIHEGKRVALTLPKGCIVSVVSGPTGEGDRLVEVVCDGQVVSVFFLDLKMRGTELKDPGSSDSEADESATG